VSQDDTAAQITQLQQQQAIFTQIIAAQLEGKWTGAESAEALLYALNPNLTGTLELDPPVTTSDVESLPKAGG
jgi:hypothetical protein